MAIHSFSPDSILEYVPEYGKNRESDSPCIVKLRFVPFVKTQEYARLITARSKHETDKASLAEIYQAVQRRQFFDNVVGVSGFTVDGKEIATPAALWEHASPHLVYELLAVMEDSQKIKAGLRQSPQ